MAVAMIYVNAHRGGAPKKRAVFANQCLAGGLTPASLIGGLSAWTKNIG
jgi:hypothetical protein